MAARPRRVRRPRRGPQPGARRRDGPRGHLRHPGRRRARPGRRRVRRALVPSLSPARRLRPARRDRPRRLERCRRAVTSGPPATAAGAGPRRSSGGPARRPAAATGAVRSDQVHWLDQVHGAGSSWSPPTGRPIAGDPGAAGGDRRCRPGDALVSDAAAGARCPSSPPTAPRWPWAATRGSSPPSTPAGGAWWPGWWRPRWPPCGPGGHRGGRALGPCIHPGCYEFADDDLDELVAASATGPGSHRQPAGPPSTSRPRCRRPWPPPEPAWSPGSTPAPPVRPGYFSHRAAGTAGARPWSCGRRRGDRTVPPWTRRRSTPVASAGAWRRSAGASARPRPTRPRCGSWR